MTASYKIALAAGGLLLLIVISSLILRGEAPRDGDATDPNGTVALNGTDRPAPGDSLDGPDGSLEDPLPPLPEPDLAQEGPPRRSSVGPPFGVSDDPATRINFIEDEALAALPEPEENGFPTLDVGRSPFESRAPLFSSDRSVIFTDAGGDESTPEPQPISLDPPRPVVAIGPTDPVSSPVTPGVTGDETAAEAEPAPRREPPILRLYTIESGDSMSSIALATYGSARKWVDIAQANPLIDPNRLKVGQEIKLPDLDGVGPDPVARGEEASEEEDDLPRAGATYTIKSGDSLSTIAKQFYGSASKWELIYQANRRRIGDDPGRLKLGTELLIPPPANGAN